MKKIGFFGGTFNPIHLGHIRMALEVYEKTGLDHLHFVPAPIPPHKKITGLLDFEKRVDFLQLSFKEYTLENIFSVSEHENTMQGPSYTYYSVQLWQELYKLTPYFIVGLEDFLQLPTWHNGLEIPEFTNFIVVKRAHYEEKDFHRAVKNYWQNNTQDYVNAKQIDESSYEVMGNTVEYIETSRMDISSTQIRNAMKEKKSVAALLPESVRHYILKHNEILDKWFK